MFEGCNSTIYDRKCNLLNLIILEMFAMPLSQIIRVNIF